MGTRPEGVKMAPVIRALIKEPMIETRVVSTGQHRELLDQVVKLFDITVDVDLAVMQPNQALASLTARLLDRIDEFLVKERPDMALVQGDTTTVLAASLACFYRKIPVGHVEAGLQSPFPEEANRKLASLLVNLHFAPTATSRNNLLNEGIDPSSITVTGNTVIDALLMEVSRQKTGSISDEINQALSAVIAPDWMSVPYVLVTGHRRENFGGGFEQICEAVRELAQRFPMYRWIYPVHLNPNVRGPVHQRLGEVRNIHLIAPQGYRNFVALMRNSKLLLTDSGGVQEEAPSLAKPVLVMRDTTERPEGVDAGTVKLIGANRIRIVDEVSRLLTDDGAYNQMAAARNPYGDGFAADRIVSRIVRYFQT
jgi:UDP-N-acetylglucosamine 2-epimerase (non-hydrolysing)